MKLKKISVIVPCYNSEKYLPECLESLEQQTIGIENVEIILVNDASKDSTWEQIIEFEKKHPESVIAINLPINRRQGGARNEGLKKATGEYIAFLDSDDMALAETYEKVYNYAIETRADIVQFDHYNFIEEREERCNNCKIKGEIEINDAEIRKQVLISEVLTMNHCSKIYRKSMLEKSKAQYAEHRIYEEPLFVYPQLFYAKRIAFIKEALYKVRIHSESTMQSEVKKPGRLLDHPEVQIQLLQYMTARPEFMKFYYNEIEFYFLKTYYLETLYFAGQANLYLDFRYFKKMQKNIIERFPQWNKNTYLQGEEMELVRRIINTCYEDYNQEELDKLCHTVYKKMVANERG